MKVIGKCGESTEGWEMTERPSAFSALSVIPVYSGVQGVALDGRVEAIVVRSEPGITHHSGLVVDAEGPARPRKIGERAVPDEGAIGTFHDPPCPRALAAGVDIVDLSHLAEIGGDAIVREKPARSRRPPSLPLPPDLAALILRAMLKPPGMFKSAMTPFSHRNRSSIASPDDSPSRINAVGLGPLAPAARLPSPVIVPLSQRKARRCG